MGLSQSTFPNLFIKIRSKCCYGDINIESCEKDVENMVEPQTLSGIHEYIETKGSLKK